MIRMNPYIHFNGNAEEAFMFYKTVFGGEFRALKRFNEMEMPEGFLVEGESENIMHIALSVGDQDVLMGSDTPKALGVQNENENRSKIVIRTDSKTEAERIFNELSVDGHIEMPIADSPWGSFFGMLRDKFGIEWMVEFDASQKE